jgi:phenylacetate-CoA ligase
MGQFFDQSSETMPREQLQALQLQKLQAMFTEIYGKNPFYTAKLRQPGFAPGDLKTLADLTHLPFTTKDELVADQAHNGFAANLTYPLAAYTRFHQTSGTTGKPLRVFDTAASWDWWGRCWGYVFAGAGLTAEDRIFCAFSFGPFIGFWAAVEGAHHIGAMLVPGGGRSSLERLHLMKETGCTALCCTPTYALHLLEVARENNFEMSDLNIHTTVHAGEPGANVPATKQRIEQGWSAHCYDHAGASEIGAHCFEGSDRRNGLYVIESEFIAEILDPASSQPVPNGEKGELVLTNLGRWGFPVIRYRTGDIVVASPDQSSGERTFLHLDGGVIGRADDMVTVRGVNVFPSAIENFVREHPQVDEFRVTVDKRDNLDKLTIELELAAGADEQTIPTLITQAISANLGLRPTVHCVSRDTLPRFELKARRFRVL